MVTVQEALASGSIHFLLHSVPIFCGATAATRRRQSECKNDRSHTRIVRSADPEINCVPSSENWTESTDAVWPVRVCSSRPSAASHILIVVSADAVANGMNGRVGEGVGESAPSL